MVAVQAQVKGVVFRDFDMNGVRSDTLPIEVGVAGVTVRAFVDLSKLPIQTPPMPKENTRLEVLMCPPEN